MLGLIKLIVGAIVIYFAFAGLSYAIPTLTVELYRPYELWLLVLLLFYVFLPTIIGDYVYKLRIKGE